MDLFWCLFFGGGWSLVLVLDMVLRLKLCCVGFGDVVVVVVCVGAVYGHYHFDSHFYRKDWCWC